MPWWLVFLPQWLGHAGHLVLVAAVLLAVVRKPVTATLTTESLPVCHAVAVEARWANRLNPAPCCC